MAHLLLYNNKCLTQTEDCGRPSLIARMQCNTPLSQHRMLGSKHCLSSNSEATQARKPAQPHLCLQHGQAALLMTGRPGCRQGLCRHLHARCCFRASACPPCTPPQMLPCGNCFGTSGRGKGKKAKSAKASSCCAPIPRAGAAQVAIRLTHDCETALPPSPAAQRMPGWLTGCYCRLHGQLCLQLLQLQLLCRLGGLHAMHHRLFFRTNTFLI